MLAGSSASHEVDSPAMDGLTFAERIVHSVLSWPVALVIAVVVLRHSLGDLIKHVRHVGMKAGGAELELDRDVAQAIAQVGATSKQSLAEAPDKALTGRTSEDAAVRKRLDELEEHAASFPWGGAQSAAVMAFDELERWLTAELARHRKTGLSSPTTQRYPMLR